MYRIVRYAKHSMFRIKIEENVQKREKVIINIDRE